MWRAAVVLWLGSAVAAVRLDTHLGSLDGRQLTTPAGESYFAFTGLPYAQPPVGPRRLREPVLQEGWSGVLDATQSPVACLHVPIYYPALRNQTHGREDCLYLNIYTRSTDPSSRLPVLFYVHGGGWRAGNPPQLDHAVTNFMNQRVVLVTVSYRLGVLGFLSTEDGEIPGNFGLKDQAMALMWIKRNVEAFGGDPSSITVFGESAGGASAHYLITSPLSRDLLRGAIAESGLVDAEWAFARPGEAKKLAESVAEIVGCSYGNSYLECLQGVQPEKLQEAEKKFLVWDFNPGVVFKPVIEVEHDGAFLTEDPRTTEVRKPLLTGMNSGEGLFIYASVMNQDDSVLNQFISNIDNILPLISNVDPDKAGQAEFAAALKERFFKDLSNREDVLNGLKSFFTEFYFLYPLSLSLRRHRGPVYLYLYDHRAEISLVQAFGPKYVSNTEPCHGDELVSLFNMTTAFPGVRGREEDRAVSNLLVQMWTNFAVHQNPAPSGSPVQWKEYKSGKNFLHIRTNKSEFIEKSFPYQEAIQFWEKIIGNFHPGHKEEL